MAATIFVEIQLVAFVKKSVKAKTLRCSKSEYSLPLVSFNTWEVIAVDCFVTFREWYGIRNLVRFDSVQYPDRCYYSIDARYFP